MLKGKIVLVPFPFDDLSATKVRPAVCLTDSIGKYNHVVLAFITSKIPENLLETDYKIDIEKGKTLGLKVPSVLRLHRLITLNTDYIKRELGVLSTDILKVINIRLKNMFQL